MKNELKEVIPTLFALNNETFNKKLNLLNFSNKIHIDYMDGKFVENKSIEINEIQNILNFPKIEFELHLMAYTPEIYASKIKKLKINKVLIQYEAFDSETELNYSLNCFKEKGIQIFLVINPGTDINEVMNYFDEIDGVMLMSVWPGKEGQKFIENTYNKIIEIRKKYPKTIIQVDGGINEENAKKLFEIGANIISVGSYISSNENPKEQFNKLEKIIK